MTISALSVTKARIRSLFCLVVVLFISAFGAAAQSAPYLVWPAPAPIPFLTPLSSVQLNATAYTTAPVPVSLSSSYNVLGVTTDGTPYYTGGYDGSSWAYSSELLGPSVSWQGVTYPLGPADAPDAVFGAMIPVPAGPFASVNLIGSLVNNVSPTVQFLLTYTDGSTTSVTQSMSDWVNPRDYPGESIVKCMPTRHNYDGTVDRNSVCVYGYALPIDPNRTLASLSLPATRNVVVLSVTMIPTVVPGTFTYSPTTGTVQSSGTVLLNATFTPARTALFSSAQASNSLTVLPPVPLVSPIINWPVPASVLPGASLTSAQLDASASTLLGPVLIPLQSAFRVNALYPDGTYYNERGFDGTSTAYSSVLLGSSLRYGGFVFPLGPPSLPDAATSATVALPYGSFSTLYLLGAAGTSAEVSQPFTIGYSDGTSATTRLSLSSWRSSQQFAGETLVSSTTYANLSNGQEQPGSYSVYGYQVPVDSTRVPVTLTLPPNPDVLILAAGLGSGTSYSIPGAFSYTPPAGTVIQSYTTLSTSFSPTDTKDFLPAQATVPLVVGAFDFVVTAPQGESVSVTRGQTCSLSFQVSPTNGRYGGPLTIYLSGTLPLYSTYSLTPNTLPSTAGPSTFTLTLEPKLLTSSLMSRRVVPSFLAGLLLLPLLSKRKRRLPSLLLCVIALALVPTGCGSGYKSGDYPLTINVTDGHFTHSLPITLHVVASPQ